MKTSFSPTSASNYLRTIFYRYLVQSVLINGHCFWPYLSKLKLKLNLNIILCVNVTFSSLFLTFYIEFEKTLGVPGSVNSGPSCSKGG